MRTFQSLSRDSGRLNWMCSTYGPAVIQVSIPQSGFGAFEPNPGRSTSLVTAKFQSLSRDSGRLNYGIAALRILCLPVSIPQSGFGAFEL